ncbi:MAG: hypothetical protein LBS86_04620 [Treponema sp.]|jgi:hypothetical protein|nr:hypothetical protein [Treponema sp.]
MNQKLIVTICVILTSVATVFPVPLEDLLNARARSALSSRDSITTVQFSNSTPVFIPRNRYTQNLVENLMQELKPSFIVESLHLYHKPTGASFPLWSEAERTTLFNSTLALSTLAGLEYYSASRKSMRVFYETSSVIDGPDTRRPIADPRYITPPFDLVLYAHQKDLTFGDNVYRYEYHTQTDALFFLQENMTSLYVGIIPAVGKNKLRSLVAVFDAGEDLLVYVVSMAKAVSIPGMNSRVGESFSNRADALLRWFSERADKAFGL